MWKRDKTRAWCVGLSEIFFCNSPLMYDVLPFTWWIKRKSLMKMFNRFYSLFFRKSTRKGWKRFDQRRREGISCRVCCDSRASPFSHGTCLSAASETAVKEINTKIRENAYSEGTGGGNKRVTVKGTEGKNLSHLFQLASLFLFGKYRVITTGNGPTAVI